MMADNSKRPSSDFLKSWGTCRGIESVEEQREINSGGVQMITISKPYPKKETNSKKELKQQSKNDEKI